MSCGLFNFPIASDRLRAVFLFGGSRINPQRQASSLTSEFRCGAHSKFYRQDSRAVLTNAAPAGHAYRAIRACCCAKAAAPLDRVWTESSMTQRRSLILSIENWRAQSVALGSR